ACYCLLTSVTPVLAYRAARQLGAPRRGALSAARLIAFSPAFAFWSSALYKEGLILMALFLIIEHALRLQHSFRLSSVVILALCRLALFGLRFYIAAILCVCLLGGLAFGRSRHGGGDGAPAVLRQALVLVVLAIALSLFGLTDRVDKLLSVSVED